MSFVVFWSDILIWTIFFVAIFSFLKISKKPDWRFSIEEIKSSTLAMCAFVIFSAYFSIALLDSVHFDFNQSGHSESILDKAYYPEGRIYEKTYSRPFSLFSYSKSIDSNKKEYYERLSHAGLDLNKDASSLDLFLNITTKICFSFFISSVLFLIVYFFLVKKFKFNLNFYVTLTLLITIFIMIFCFYMSRFYHVFGTGKVGQDILYVTLKSIRTGIMIGSLTTLFTLPLSLAFGVLAGFYGGFVDDIIQYFYTTMSSIPSVLLIAASVLVLNSQIDLNPNWFKSLEEQADLRLISLCFILGVTSWASLCRFVRAETLKLREMDYVMAARCFGQSDLSIIWKHILPNLIHIALIITVLDFSGLVLAEAVLSYVGVGVDPSIMSWGNMINSARMELSRTPVVWWPLLAAFLGMFFLVICANLLADKIREAFNPRMRLK
jgi:peptide/nickel transport system permease protein